MRQFEINGQSFESKQGHDRFSMGFDPDRRVDVVSTLGEVSESYDPDKRLIVESGVADKNDLPVTEDGDREIRRITDDYLDDLKSVSEAPDTIPDRPFEVSELRRLSPEEVAEKREEFVELRNDLRDEWEEKYGREWPRYERDVVINGHVVRKAGDRYDAHHIKPLALGGDNVVENITPIRMDKHQGKDGIHASERPCDKLIKMIGDIK